MEITLHKITDKYIHQLLLLLLSTFPCQLNQGKEYRSRSVIAAVFNSIGIQWTVENTYHGHVDEQTFTVEQINSIKQAIIVNYVQHAHSARTANINSIAMFLAMEGYSIKIVGEYNNQVLINGEQLYKIKQGSKFTTHVIDSDSSTLLFADLILNLQHVFVDNNEAKSVNACIQQVSTDRAFKQAQDKNAVAYYLYKYVNGQVRFSDTYNPCWDVLRGKKVWQIEKLLDLI